MEDWGFSISELPSPIFGKADGPVLVGCSDGDGELGRGAGGGMEDGFGEAGI